MYHSVWPDPALIPFRNSLSLQCFFFGAFLFQPFACSFALSLSRSNPNWLIAVAHVSLFPCTTKSNQVFTLPRPCTDTLRARGIEVDS